MSDQVVAAPNLAAVLAILGEAVAAISRAQVSDPEAGADLLTEIDDLMVEVIAVMRDESPGDSSERQGVLTKARDLIDRLYSAGWVESLGPGPGPDPPNPGPIT